MCSAPADMNVRRCTRGAHLSLEPKAQLIAETEMKRKGHAAKETRGAYWVSFCPERFALLLFGRQDWVFTDSVILARRLNERIAL